VLPCRPLSQRWAAARAVATRPSTSSTRTRSKTFPAAAGTWAAVLLPARSQ